MGEVFGTLQAERRTLAAAKTHHRLLAVSRPTAPKRLHKGSRHKRFYGSHLLLVPLASSPRHPNNFFGKRQVICLGEKTSLARTAL